MFVGHKLQGGFGRLGLLIYLFTAMLPPSVQWLLASAKSGWVKQALRLRAGTELFYLITNTLASPSHCPTLTSIMSCFFPATTVKGYDSACLIFVTISTFFRLVTLCFMSALTWPKGHKSKCLKIQNSKIFPLLLNCQQA